MTNKAEQLNQLGELTSFRSLVKGSVIKNTLLALVFVAAPAFGSTLRCEASRLAMFAGLTIRGVNVDAKTITVSKPWKWENGVTVTGLSSEITRGQHGSATLRAYSGTLSLLPTSRGVGPRIATRNSVHCFFKR